jgi:hypothetical protein
MTNMTHRHFAAVVLLGALAVGALGAQSTTPPAKAPEAPQRSLPDPAGQPTNIKLDFTITDQTGPGDPSRKVVTMVVADRGNGSIRSSGMVRPQGPVRINVDASPIILQNGDIRLRLGLEYNPRASTADSGNESPSLTEQMTVILDLGKPMVISQAADPASDRKITVEVRAALLK